MSQIINKAFKRKNSYDLQSTASAAPASDDKHKHEESIGQHTDNNIADSIKADVKNNTDPDTIEKTSTDKADMAVTIEDNSIKDRLIYGLTDFPPVFYLLLFAIQQSCLAIATPLSTTFIVAEAVCAKKEPSIQVRILASTMIMTGISTFAVTTLGVRLPVFQGPAPTYIIPLITMMSLPQFKCPETYSVTNIETNTSVLMAAIPNGTDVPNYDIAVERINAYAGSLLAVGAIHALIGLTGLVGIIARFVGPVTIVPAILLFGIFIHRLVVSFSATNWPIAIITAATCIILGIFLASRRTPIPVWTPKKGFHIVWTPIHQVFALLISIIVGWLVSFIMTEYGALSDDPDSPEYNARTDANTDALKSTDWFLIPYPGQFGTPSFSGAAFGSFLVSSLISVLDSIGDYNAVAKVVSAPPIPRHALNRGIAVEGLMSVISGSLGCGHATVSFGENIGAMQICKVACRSVFQAVGILYAILAVLGKVGAFFISIPYPVIGGTQIITFGLLIGVIISYMHLIDLNSSRNVSIMGIAILLGMMMPHWVTTYPNAIDTGITDLDSVLIMCLSNPSLVGGLFACILDNTVPGTMDERGITAQLGEIGDEKALERSYTSLHAGQKITAEIKKYKHGLEVYRLPFIPNCFRKTKIAKFIPIIDSQG